MGIFETSQPTPFWPCYALVINFKKINVSKKKETRYHITRILCPCKKNTTTDFLMYYMNIALQQNEDYFVVTMLKKSREKEEKMNDEDNLS